MTRVLISYSHDSVEHKALVLRLADRLRLDGVECELDQYINGSPPEGWIRWMEDRIEWADFVLLVCTPNYLRRYRGQELAAGRGVAFEGVVISQTLYDDFGRNTKFIAVLPESGSVEDIPRALRAFTAYRMTEYEALYRVLTGQPATPPPDVGSQRELGHAPRDLGSIAASTIHNDNTTTTTKKPMSDTLRANWIGVLVVLAGAILTAIVVWVSDSSSVNIEQSPCAVGNTGTISGSITQTCTGDQP